jgi:hypothetical protein
MESLESLIFKLKKKYPGVTVHGHNEYSAKACPGFRAGDWWENRPPRATIAQSTTSQAAGGVAAAGTTAAGAGLLAPSGEDVQAGATAAGDLLTRLEQPERLALIVGGVLVIALAIWIFRERLRKWKGGWR